MTTTVIKGVTWAHSRGLTPLLAISQRFMELHPQVKITWTTRSLQAFADFSVEQLTAEYDLLIIDHPWVGTAAATQCVLPLNEFLPASFMEDQQMNSVGKSHESYFFGTGQWAMAIDAATPAASYRKDLFEQFDEQIPTTWEALIALAKRGKVALPAIPIDILMNFYSFCIANGQHPFTTTDKAIDDATGLLALEMMKELYGLLDASMFNNNPIAVADLMTSTNDYWYCPFAYCYSNYARRGYAKHLLSYDDVVSYKGKKMSTTIGGTGLAVSAFSQQQQLAIEFVRMAVSPECQQTMYVEHGGQPAHLAAWQNTTANLLTNQFFKNVFPVMENGYIRPRYHGYLHFQDHAGKFIQQYFLSKISARATLQQMNTLYKESLVLHQTGIAI